MNLRMRNLPATLRALAIASVCCEGSAIAAAAARNAPFVLIVPYFTVVGDIRASNSVSVYKIDAATGAPRLAAGSPFAVGRDPSDEALAPGGRFAYVINKGSNSVSAFEVGAATGALRPVAGSPFTVDYSASGPNGIVVDPTGKYAYVVSDAGVSAFSVNATTGALVRVPGSPFAKGTSDGFGTTAIAVDPRGKFAYVLDYFNNTVSAYTIDAAGALKLKGSPLAAGQNSNDPGSFNSVRVAPNGRFLYVTGTCCINVYAIDATTGALAPPAHLSLGLLGEGTLTGFRIDPTGKFAYVADDGSRVYTYTINAATGALKAAAGRKFALRTGTGSYTGPYSVTIDPKGTFAYVFDSGSRVARPTISVYRRAYADAPFTIRSCHQWHGSNRTLVQRRQMRGVRWNACGRNGAASRARFRGSDFRPRHCEDEGVLLRSQEPLRTPLPQHGLWRNIYLASQRAATGRRCAARFEQAAHRVGNRARLQRRDGCEPAR